jgi:hypothetical protein
VRRACARLGFFCRDRVICLLLRAHVASALDLGKADVLDPLWWKKATFIINEFERATAQKLAEYEYQFSLALIDYDATEEVLRMSLESAETLLTSLTSTAQPWEPAQAVGGLRNDIAAMREQYVATFGDPDTPEFQAELARTIAYLNRDR